MSVSGLLLSKCCPCDPGPCNNQFPLCASCGYQWIPRFRVQATLPGASRPGQWILTRYGPDTWGYADTAVAWLITYSAGGSPWWTVQLTVGGEVWTYEFSGYGPSTPLAGYLIGPTGDPPDQLPFRACALGTNIAREYTLTTSGLSLCGDWAATGGHSFTPSGVCAEIMLYVKALLSGSLNGTFVLEYKRTLSGYGRDGCGIYETAAPVATVLVGSGVPPWPESNLVYDAYFVLSYVSGGPAAVYLSLRGGIGAGWCTLVPPSIPPEMAATAGEFIYLAALPSTYCDTASTVDFGARACANGPWLQGGYATVVPSHDDAWLPPGGP